jgi:hypothetical protein
MVDGDRRDVWWATLRCREVIEAYFTEYFEQHRGFLLKEMLTQSQTAEVMEGQLRSGGFLVDERGDYMEVVHRSLNEIASKPHIVGLSSPYDVSADGQHFVINANTGQDDTRDGSVKEDPIAIWTRDNRVANRTEAARIAYFFIAQHSMRRRP